MTEPTITQSGALYLAQHKLTKRYRARGRRLLATGINRLRDLRTRTISDLLDVRRLNLQGG
jgi:hypothetical protein